MPTGALKRVLGLGECVFFGVGVILGAGIYAIIGEAAAFAGNMLWLAFAGASLAALLTACAYAELVGMYPRAGGEYAYARAALGERAALVLGSTITLNGIVSGATIAVGFAGYLVQLVAVPRVLAALGIVLALLAVNAAGIRQSSRMNIAFTLIELGGLVFVLTAALPSVGSVDLLAPPPTGVDGLCVAAALSFFAYIGFEDVVKLAEETRDPERTIPKALFLSAAIVMALYGLVAVAAVSAVPPTELAAGHSPLAAVIATRHGRIGVAAISVIALFSTSNSILSNMLGSSRVLRGMTERRPRLAALARVWPRTGTPVIGLALIAALMAAFTLIGEIRVIALIGNFFIFLTFLIVNACVVVLRIRRPEAKRHFRIRGSVRGVPVLPVVASLLLLVLIGYSVRGLVLAGLD